MKKMQISKEQEVIVDDEDFAKLSKYNWYALNTPWGFYAYRIEYSPKRFIYLHRELLGLKHGDRRKGDHVDGNHLNCQRSNLRIATAGQNSWKQRKWRKKTSSKYKGVSLDKRKKAKGRPWYAYIKKNRRRKFLGYFESQEQAADAYDEAAEKMFGTFACLNRAA